MRKLLATLAVILLASGLTLAQEKKEKKAPEERKVSGEIVSIDTAKSTITVTKGNVLTTLQFNDSTQWTKQEKDKIIDIKRDEFKIGARVICMAKEEAGKWVARRCDLRPTP